jgi:hypothetical protein
MRETTGRAYEAAFADLGAAYNRFSAKLTDRPRFKKNEPERLPGKDYANNRGVTGGP